LEKGASDLGLEMIATLALKVEPAGSEASEGDGRALALNRAFACTGRPIAPSSSRRSKRQSVGGSVHESRRAFHVGGARK
jgi:hypothetical protein